MLIRKNTKAFKTILQILHDCQDKPERAKLIRLYITKAGHSIQERIHVEGIQDDSALFYEMNYQTVLASLTSSNHQLYQSDDLPGIYYFQSNATKGWDQTPFEFDEAILKAFPTLPELPAVRKKEKAQKFILPTPVSNDNGRVAGKDESNGQKEKPTAKEKTKILKPDKAVKKDPHEPAYKLKHKIHFTDLDAIVFRQANVSKRDVLDYYYNVAAHLLPYLKDRPIWTRLHPDDELTPIESIITIDSETDEVPGWLKPTHVRKGKTQHDMFLCNTLEQLLYYVERGCLEFSPGHARIKSFGYPDYTLIRIDASDLTKVIEVALTAKEILEGLKLPSFVKTNGISGLHVYVSLDAKSKFEASHDAAKYICKLIALKIPGVTSFNLAEDDVYGKVLLDYSVNSADKSVVAPYSIVPGKVANVAAPLLWEEVTKGLSIEDLNLKTILKENRRNADSFDVLFKKKVNADDLFQRLEGNYGFLLK